MPLQPLGPGLKEACALLDAGVARGTGFLVSSSWLLTCHHVIKDADNGRILATFPHGEYEATVELLDVANDCALLRLMRPVPPDVARPLVLTPLAAHKGSAWEGYGFPAATGQAGLLIDGRVQDPEGQDPAFRPAVVLQSANVTAGSWLNGLSGSPVVAEGKVIGQMRKVILNAEGGAQMAVIYACPAAVLAELAQRRMGGTACRLPNPYRGLSAFRPEDAHVFFGREELVEKLWQRVRAIHQAAGERRLLAVLGPSGSGKSSVALAGLLPALRARPIPGPEPPRVVTFKPGRRPLESLARALVPLLPIDATVLPAVRQLAIETLLRSEAIAGEGLRRFAADLPDIASIPLVVVVDQLEEIYTLCREPAQRTLLVDLLLHAASDAGREVSVVLTLRSDFLDQVQRQHPKLSQAIAAQHELVPAMNRAQMRRAIAEPAWQAGRRLDDAIVGLLLAQAHGSEGTLPLLEFALTRIWEGLSLGKEAAVTLEEIGGVGGALARQAQAVYDHLSPGEQRLAQRAFVRMVQLGEGTRDTRRRIAISELCSHGETEAQVLAVLRPFADERARLVTLSSTAEVTHEALFEHWTVLRKWIDDSRADLRFHDRVTEAARLWHETNRPAGRLWRPPDLDLLSEYLTRRPDELTQQEQDFFRAAKQQQEAELAAQQEAERRLRETHEQLRQQLLSTYVETGRQLLRQGDSLKALLWLHRAHEQGSREPSLRYLLAEAMRPVDATEQILVGHQASVLHASLSPAGERVVTASADRTARLWDTSTGRELALLAGHLGSVISAAFSPDGARIVTASTDKTARLWNGRSGHGLATLVGHTDSVMRAAFSPDGTRIVTASLDGTTRLWDGEVGKPIVVLAQNTAPVLYAAFSPDGKRMVTASVDHCARLWDVTTDQCLATLQGHTGSVLHAVFSPDGTRVITASADKTAQLWDAQTGQALAKFSGHTDLVSHAAFRADGALAVTASADKTARVWDTQTGQLLNLLTGHSSAVECATFSPDGTLVLTAGTDKTARIWDRKSGQLVAVLQGHMMGVTHAAWSRDEARIITASADGTVRLWRAHFGQLVVALQGHTESVEHAAFSADDQRVVTSSKDKSVRIWDARTGQVQAVLLGHTASVGQAEFSPDSEVALTASEDATVRLWDSRTGHRLAMLSGHQDRIAHATFSRSGDRAATASADQTARLWAVKTGQRLATLSGHEAPVVHIAFSPDGTRLLTTSWDHTARIWDSESGGELFVLVGHAGTVSYAEFSPDGTRVVTASDDTTARVWDTQTGELLAEFLGHTDTVRRARFSADGTRLVTASWDGTARLWDARTGRLLGELRGHADCVGQAVFSQDGTRVLTASADTTARLWNVGQETRTAAEVAAWIRCRVPLRFQGDVIIPRVPEFSRCQNIK